MGRLEMINVDALIFDDPPVSLGAGAFGEVFQGLWKVSHNALAKHRLRKGTKLQVAIKVIKNDYPISPGIFSRTSPFSEKSFFDPEEESRRAAARATIEELLQEAKVSRCIYSLLHVDQHVVVATI